MPCESCHVQFTVFRRKRVCCGCKCFYCSNCLISTKQNGILCKRCGIFARRPLLRSDLLQLKPKDLIFYLQSKHISTTGCVEKEELVRLVLAHIEQGGTSQTASTSSNPSDEQSVSFDSLKQSCQNFFTNLTDNISDSLASFESKSTAKNGNNEQYGFRDYETPHISDQPRVNTREIPTYASFQNSQANITPVTDKTECNSQAASPGTCTIALSQITPHSYLEQFGTASTSTSARIEKSDCECSDDEIITAFSERISIEAVKNCQTSLKNAAVNKTNSSGLGLLTATSSSPGYSKQGSLSSKVDICGAVDISTPSSFEELGAIGGISDESKTTTETNSSNNMDQWQLVVTRRLDSEVDVESSNADEIIEVVLHSELTPKTRNNSEVMSKLSQNVTRRRSDGFLNKCHNLSDDESTSHVLNVNLETSQEQSKIANHANSSNCQQCGKNKTNIRRRVERMRRHLENSQMSEENIKQELKEFLFYLEQRTKSFDYSDAESGAVSTLSDGNGATIGEFTTPAIEFSSTPATEELDDNVGIHVYASQGTTANIDSRFISLEDFEDFKDLENLTVKQLKEVLMLHRVDYKGCCEKQELLDRVERLWRNLRSAPVVEKLATDELCKICMDAPIECVFLECGHMATCTNCGKVLNECPICRQYIVRVVRFFRA